MTAVLENALRWADGGFAVLPVGFPTKRPLMPKGYEPLTDAATIEAVFNRPPLRRRPQEEIAVGLRAGPRYLVLDVDTKNGARGYESLRRLQSYHGELPETPRLTTPSGGSHIWLSLPDTVTLGSKDLAPGIDTRSSTGYLMAPGTPGYVWTNGDVLIDGAAMAPEWVVDRLSDKLVPTTHIESVYVGDCVIGTSSTVGETRSEEHFHFLRRLFATGASIDDAYEASKRFAPAVEKYGDGQRLLNDVQRIWAKLLSDPGRYRIDQLALEQRVNAWYSSVVAQILSPSLGQMLNGITSRRQRSHLRIVETFRDNALSYGTTFDRSDRQLAEDIGASRATVQSRIRELKEFIFEESGKDGQPTIYRLHDVPPVEAKVIQSDDECPSILCPINDAWHRWPSGRAVASAMEPGDLMTAGEVLNAMVGKVTIRTVKKALSRLVDLGYAEKRQAKFVRLEAQCAGHFHHHRKAEYHAYERSMRSDPEVILNHRPKKAPVVTPERQAIRDELAALL